MPTSRRRTKRAYASIQAWMDATGTNQQHLAKLLDLSQSHLCNVLRGNRKASFSLAIRMSQLTNVPLETIYELARAA